jgi:MFS superfamily sulfate permease-like transporter
VLTGLSVAGLMLPEGVAYAAIAGLAPGRALAAGVAGGLAYALVGRSRFAVLSPTSSSAAILAAAIAGLGAGAGGGEPARAALAAAIVVLVGILFLGLALFRLGGLSSFISRPVLRGFSFGLAATIIIKQLPRLLGVHPASGPIWTVVGGVARAWSQWNWPSLLLGGAALAALLAFRRAPQWPGALLVITAGIALGMFAQPESWGIALAGPVTLVMPAWQLPPLVLWPRLAQLAVPIALILFAESWGTMRGLALKHGDTLNANRELGGIGVANIAAAIVQGMPVGAGFSVGSANEAAGAQSRFAAVVASLAILALALFASRWIARIPEPVLAAVVIAALTHALGPGPFLHLFRIRRDQWVAIGAALGVLAMGVLNGMLAAIVLSVALLLYDFSRPAISELGRVGDSSDFVDLANHADARRAPGIAIYRPNAPLFFANAETALRLINARIRTGNAAAVVLSLEESNDLDSTALEALGEFAQALAHDGRRLILARTHDAVRDLLTLGGLSDLAKTSTFSVADAVKECEFSPPKP